MPAAISASGTDWLKVSVLLPPSSVSSSTKCQTFPSPTTFEVSESRWGGSQESIVNVSGLTSSPSAFIRNSTDPDAGSPVQVPTQRSSRSDSVTAAHTESMGAGKVRSNTTLSWPSRVARRPVGLGVMLAPPLVQSRVAYQIVVSPYFLGLVARWM